MESPEVAEFRRCILDGAWDRAEAGLMHLGVTDDPRFWVSAFTPDDYPSRLIAMTNRRPSS